VGARLLLALLLAAVLLAVFVFLAILHVLSN
jgi:hypothetical protein